METQTTFSTLPVQLSETETETVARRWFGTGRSVDSDARVAGSQAASAALDGRRASLVVVFCPATIDLAAMLEAVRAEAGDVPLIGCTGASQYTAEDPAEPAVVVSALGGEGFEIHTSVAMNVSAGQRVAGEHVGESVHSLTREHRMLLLLCDGLAGNQHELVRGAYTVVGATVPLAGGCASDALAYVETSQFYSDSAGVHIVSNAVVAAAIGSEAPIGIAAAHGWRRVGEPMLVTSSESGHVSTLDGEPALDVFLRHTGATRSILDDAQEFRAFSLNHPFGLSRRSGEDIRVVHRCDPEDGSITCLGGVPQGTLLWAMEADQPGVLASVDEAYDDALAQLDGAPPLGLLAFDCVVRHLFLGKDGVSEEVDRLAGRASGAPVAGFYTYGEVARTRGARGMHYVTLVLVAFA